MANTLRIKRTTTSNRPSSLANAELAFIEGSETLVYGIGTGGVGGSATSIIDIGGDGVGNTDASQILMNGTQAAGNSKKWARANHVHPTDTSRAPLASPTLTGVPAAPTAAADTNTTQLATTAFVVGQASSTNPAALGSVAIGTSLKFARADHVHAMPVLSALGAPTSAVSLNSQKITNLATPTADTDAATKAYVDAARSGLDVKGSCRVASTGSISFGAGNETTISGAPLVVDGVTLVAGDRVLVKDQLSSQFMNGIWEVVTPGTGSTGSWTRPSDFAGSAVTAGAFTFITEGSTNADSGWVLTTNDPTWGMTALTFAQFSGAGQITAGAGLTKTGNTLDVVGTTDRITVNADSIDIASTYAGQSSITTVGTISNGTWSATTIAVNKGGTGLTSYAIGDLIYASGATTLAKLAAAAVGKVLISKGTGTAPEWSSDPDGLTIDGGSY